MSVVWLWNIPYTRSLVCRGHLTRATFRALDCGYAATYKRDLKRHIEGVHESIKHVCKECGYAASQKGDLLRHNEASHENIGKYVNILGATRLVKIIRAT